MKQLQFFKDIVKEYKEGNKDIINQILKCNEHNGIVYYVFNPPAIWLNKLMKQVSSYYKNSFSYERIQSEFLLGFTLALKNTNYYDYNAKVMYNFEKTIRGHLAKVFNEEYKGNFIPAQQTTKQNREGQTIKTISFDELLENLDSDDENKRVKSEKIFSKLYLDLEDIHYEDEKEKSNDPMCMLLSKHFNELKLTERQAWVYQGLANGLTPSKLSKFMYPDDDSKKRNKKINKAINEIKSKIKKLASENDIDLSEYKKIKNKKDKENKKEPTRNKKIISEYQYIIDYLKNEKIESKGNIIEKLKKKKQQENTNRQLIYDIQGDIQTLENTYDYGDTINGEVKTYYDIELAKYYKELHKKELEKIESKEYS